MAIIRTYAEVQKLGPNTAERTLIAKCKAGEQCRLGAKVPTEPSDTCTIRADILRYLLLGGCEKCVVDGRGVWLIGGYIQGPLDLDYATANGATQLRHCYFEHTIRSVQTQFTMVDLSDSTLKGWVTHGAKIDGNVFLRKVSSAGTIDLNSTTIDGQLEFSGAHLNVPSGTALNLHTCKIDGHVFLVNTAAEGMINFNSAKIGGQLDCTGAQVTSQHAYAIAAPDAHISGGIRLHPRTKDEQDAVETHFHCTGEIRLNGAHLGGVYAQHTTLVATSSGQTLSLGGATIEGPVRLDGCNSTGELLVAGSRISGRLTCERITLRNDNGHAFNGQAMRVGHSFVWKKVEHASGAVSLNGAHVAELNDDPDNWPDRDALFLDGFTYDRIKGKVSTSPARMHWLENGSFFDGEFRPQPYSQYAKFLRAVGHDSDARNVLEQSEALARQDQRRRRMNPVETPGLNDLQWMANSALTALDRTVLDPAFKWVIGYGHAPFRALRALLVLILLCFIPSLVAYHKGDFAPNSALLLVSEGWAEASMTDNPAKTWAAKTGDGRDWESFSAGAYAVDVVIPIINFGQTDAWAPSTTRGWWGYHLWWARWVFTVLGWLVTALGAAAITGIIRRE